MLNKFTVSRLNSAPCTIHIHTRGLFFLANSDRVAELLSWIPKRLTCVSSNCVSFDVTYCLIAERHKCDPEQSLILNYNINI
jgi:hypothetical protein